jgi:hypothetical protein
MKQTRKSLTKLAVIFGLSGLAATAALAHHSFAMYDLTVTKVFTGVVTRVDPMPNHMSILFAPMNSERKNVERDADGNPVVWSVEMQGSSQMARQGVTVSSYPPGTIISVALHPVRAGDLGGVRVGGLFRCPDRTPPAPGMHCDSVAGNIAVGDEPLPEPVEP